MKNFSIAVVAAVAIYLFGYFSYPLFNDVQNNPASITELQSETLSVSAAADNPASVMVVDAQQQATARETKVTDDTSTSSSSDLSESESTSNIASHTTNVTHADKEDRQQWSIAHQQRIVDLVNAYASDETREFIQQKILDNNEFLSGNDFKQDPAEDENWAYNMEQQLEMLILEHEMSDNFELLNLVCKQLTCDIFGIESKGNSWIQIYISLLKTVPNAEFSTGINDPKQLSFIENDGALIYAQLRFTSS